MTIHALFTRPRPAAVPALFPVGMDKLLTERFDAIRLHDDNAHRVPAHIIAWQLAWAFRLTARIAQVVS